MVNLHEVNHLYSRKPIMHCCILLLSELITYFLGLQILSFTNPLRVPVLNTKTYTKRMHHYKGIYNTIIKHIHTVLHFLQYYDSYLKQII